MVDPGPPSWRLGFPFHQRLCIDHWNALNQALGCHRQPPAPQKHGNPFNLKEETNDAPLHSISPQNTCSSQPPCFGLNLTTVPSPGPGCLTLPLLEPLIKKNIFMRSTCTHVEHLPQCADKLAGVLLGNCDPGQDVSWHLCSDPATFSGQLSPFGLVENMEQVRDVPLEQPGDTMSEAIQVMP